MRDAHRMKEKYDLSLDNRQIVSLTIAGIVVLGAVFVLGVVVGKKLAESDKAAGAPDLLSALDQKAAALDKVHSEPSTTFQDELTKKAPPAPREPAPAAKPSAAEPSKAAAAAKAAAEAKPAETKSTEPRVAEAKPAETKPAPVEAKPAREDDAEKPAAVAEAPKPAPAKSDKAGKPAEPAPAVKKESLADKIKAAAAEPKPVADGKVPEAAVATRTAEKKEAPAAAAPKVQPAVGKGAYTLQLSATQTREEADRFASGLKQKGYAPYIVAAQVPNKGTWYRVRLGSFPSRDAASRYLQDFKRETQMDAFIAAKDQ